MKHLLIILTVIFICSCRTSFVGEITYGTTIISNDSDQSTYDYMTEKYGDTLQISYYDNGDMKRTHFNGSLDYQLYSANDGAVYFVYHNTEIDTFPCTSFSLNKIYKKRIDDSVIIGKPCKCYEFLSISKNSGDSVLIEACYPSNKKGIRVRPKLFKTYQDYYIHELFKQNKTPYFKYHINYSDVSIHYDGIKMTRRTKNTSNKK